MKFYVFSFDIYSLPNVEVYIFYAVLYHSSSNVYTTKDLWYRFKLFLIRNQEDCFYGNFILMLFLIQNIEVLTLSIKYLLLII